MSLEEILDYLENPPEVNSVTFHWPAAQVIDLLLHLRRVSEGITHYDIQSETMYIYEIARRDLRYHTRDGLCRLLRDAIQRSARITGPEIGRQMELVRERGFSMDLFLEVRGHCILHCDMALGEDMSPLCEIS